MTHPSPILKVVAALAVMITVTFDGIATEGENLLAKLSEESRLDSMIQNMVTAMGAHRFDDALKIIEEAEKIAPNDPVILNAKAAAFMQTDRLEEANGILTKILEENPNFFQADYNLGELVFRQGRYAEARQHFERLRTAYGDMPLIRFKLLLCEIFEGDETAAEIRARSFRFPIDTPAWYFAHAALAKHEGNSRDAQRLIDVATEIHGHEATTLFSESIESSFPEK